MSTEMEKDLQNIVLPPKKKRVVKRFTSKEEITKRIDKFRKKATEQRRQQALALQDKKTLLEMSAREKNDLEQTSLVRQARRKQDIADGWGKKANRLELVILPQLSRKLAEFQTDVIPGVTEDRSVPGLL